MTWVAVSIGIASFAHGVRMERQGRKENKKQEKKADQLLEEQRQRQARLDAMAKPWLNDSNQNLGLVQQYLRQLASGDRAQTMQAVAPQINQMVDQQRGMVQTQRNLMPRGGAGAAATAQLPQQLQSNVNNLLFSVRPQAIQQLGTLGSNQASLGLGAMGQGAGLTNSMLQYGLDARQQAFNQGMMSGQGMFGYMDWAARMYNQMQANKNTSTPGPYVNNAMPNQNLLNNWGQGSSAGFGRTSPTPSTAAGGPMSQWGVSNTYVPAGNPYSSGKSTQ